MSHLTLQVPDPVLADARKLAEREQLTVEEYFNRLLADAVQVDSAWQTRVERGQRVSRGRYLELLDKAPDIEPEATDRVE